jgi:type VI secretion system VasD/TssJ family lipoprotein
MRTGSRRALGGMALLGLVILCGLGCATTPPPPKPCDTPPPFHLTLESSWKLNPGQDGRSLHTIVQVLQLRDLSRLQAAEFSPALLQRPQDVLGDDLVGEVNELPLAPGDTTTHWYKRQADARYVAVIGMFLESQGGKRWWGAYKLEPAYVPKCSDQVGLDQARIPQQDDAQPRFYLENYWIEARAPAPRRLTSDTADASEGAP